MASQCHGLQYPTEGKLTTTGETGSSTYKLREMSKGKEEVDLGSGIANFAKVERTILNYKEVKYL